MPLPVTVHHGACETFDFPRTHFLPPFPCLRLAHLLTTVSPHAAQPRVKQAWSATEAVQFCGLPPWGPGCARLRVQPCGYGGMCRSAGCTPDVWLYLFHHILCRCRTYPLPCGCCGSTCSTTSCVVVVLILSHAVAVARLVPSHAVSLSHLTSPMRLLLPTCSITCCVVVAPILSHAVAPAAVPPTQYDLYAVANHHGDRANHGHYTATAQHPLTRDWWVGHASSCTPSHHRTCRIVYVRFYRGSYCVPMVAPVLCCSVSVLTCTARHNFNDSYVTRVPRNCVVSNAAYVLFYHRLVPGGDLVPRGLPSIRSQPAAAVPEVRRLRLHFGGGHHPCMCADSARVWVSVDHVGSGSVRLEAVLVWSFVREGDAVRVLGSQSKRVGCDGDGICVVGEHVVMEACRRDPAMSRR